MIASLPTVGHYMIAWRKDNREFRGYVESVKQTSKGMLVVLCVADSEKHTGIGYRSFYMESLSGWDSHRDGEYLSEIYRN